MSEPTKMSELKWDGGPQRLSDEDCRWLTEFLRDDQHREAAALAIEELLEARAGLRKLADWAWHPTHLIQNVNHYRKILAALGYAPKESE
jgi:hypothetical protein